MALDSEAIEHFIDRGREQRHVEFKAAGDLGKYEDKIKKAALAFPNLEGGGYLIIGVREVNPHELEADGLSQKQLQSFDPDHVTAKIDPYVDPYVECDVYPRELSGGEEVMVIEFDEFDDVPVVAKKSLVQAGIKEGSIYTRRGRPVETTEVSDHNDLREILDLAARKRVRTMEQHAKVMEGAREGGSPQTDTERFDEELGDF